MSSRRFQRVAVLMGGPSSEREVSLASGAAVARGLRAAGYDVTEIDVADTAFILPRSVEAVFIALHGTFGEDGTLQQILEKQGMPYTGSGPEASSRSFDKRVSKEIFTAAGLPTPRYEIVSAAEDRTLALPVVTKPIREGSSIGVHRVFEEFEWTDAIKDSLSYGGEAMVEAFIDGRELTVGVVGTDVLPVIEIRPPEGYYNYEAKYTKGRTEYLVPAPIPVEWAEQCQQLAMKAFKALDCRGMGRIDFRMSQDGSPYILENNSIPGFTETSLLPKAARAAGIEFPELCGRIMEMANV